MKVVRLILKLVAVMLSVTAVACAIIAYWDRIVDFFYGIQDKIEEETKKAASGILDNIQVPEEVKKLEGLKNLRIPGL